MFDRTLPNDSAIQLTDGSIRPSDIRLNFTDIRPLVFINACHGGRVGFNFTKIGGWAEKFVNARVGVFIGAMWEVNDELALQFAETFYTALLKDNLTVAQSFQKSRQTICEIAPYNSTWLAYTLYADPEARINKNELESSRKNIEGEDETEINKIEKKWIKKIQEKYASSSSTPNILRLIAKSMFVIFCLILTTIIWNAFGFYNTNKLNPGKINHEQS
jgi:CHAT domain